MQGVFSNCLLFSRGEGYYHEIFISVNVVYQYYLWQQLYNQDRKEKVLGESQEQQENKKPCKDGNGL